MTFFVICKRLLVPRPNFWSLATSPGHVGIQRGKLMWHKNQPGPIRCFTWADPSNSAFLMYFFLLFFASYMGLAQQFDIFFLAIAFYSTFFFTLNPFIVQFCFGPRLFCIPSTFWALAFSFVTLVIFLFLTLSQ